MRNQALQSTRFSAKDALRSAVLALQQAHVQSASMDARLLLEHVLGIGREEWLADDRLMLTTAQQAEYEALIGRRAERQPVSQLTQRREFWSLNFRVTQDTLDPRPDSETLIEAVMARLPDRTRAWRMLDLGTGTGCLLLALLKEYDNARGTGVDISEEALAVARENARNLGLEGRAAFMRSDWGAALEDKGPFEVLVSNPPYIPTAAIASLAPEVRNWEPRLALDGGEDGLDCYRALMPRIKALLAKDGLAALEIGMGQQEDVETIARENGLTPAGSREDLGGIARCVMLRRKDND